MTGKTTSEDSFYKKQLDFIPLCSLETNRWIEHRIYIPCDGSMCWALTCGPATWDSFNRNDCVLIRWSLLYFWSCNCWDSEQLLFFAKRIFCDQPPQICGLFHDFLGLHLILTLSWFSRLKYKFTYILSPKLPIYLQNQFICASLKSFSYEVLKLLIRLQLLLLKYQGYWLLM